PRLPGHGRRRALPLPAMPSPRDGATTLGSMRFHFLDWGTEGRPPLLLLHGGAQTAHSWDEVAPDLARDHHVLALDQRGHGDSDRAPGGRYRRDDFVGDVRAFLDDRGWPAATVMALSLGGLNAIAFAATHPERVRGLVVVDVTPTISQGGGKAIAAQLAVRDFGSFEEAVARAVVQPAPDGREPARAAPACAPGDAGRAVDVQV